MQQLFVCHKLLLVFAFSPVLLSVIFLTALCCSKKKKKIPTTSLKSEILQQEDSQTIQVTVKEPPAEVSVPASTKDKPAASSKVVNSTVIPVEKTVQKSPSSTEVPQGAKQKPSTATSATSLLPSAAAATKPSKTTKTLKKSKEQGKVAETGKKKVSSPVAAPPNTKKGKDVISLVPMSPSTPTSVPTVSSKDSSGTSKNLTDTPKTATADASGSSAIFEVEEDSSDVSIGKKRKSAAIRAQEDGPEDEMTDPGSYHTLADMNVDKVFKRVG